MSIPNAVSAISSGFELLREDGNLSSESDWIFNGEHEILEADSRWIATAHQRRTSGTARSLHIIPMDSKTLLSGELVNVRSGCAGAA